MIQLGAIYYMRHWSCIQSSRHKAKPDPLICGGRCPGKHYKRPMAMVQHQNSS